MSGLDLLAQKGCPFGSWLSCYICRRFDVECSEYDEKPQIRELRVLQWLEAKTDAIASKVTVALIIVKGV